MDEKSNYQGSYGICDLEKIYEIEPPPKHNINNKHEKRPQLLMKRVHKKQDSSKLTGNEEHHAEPI